MLADVSAAAAAAAPDPARVVPAVHVVHVQGQQVGPQALSLLLGVASTTTTIAGNAGSDSGATNWTLVTAVAAAAAAWTPTAAVRRKTPREAREVSVVEHERLELPQERRRDLHL